MRHGNIDCLPEDPMIRKCLLEEAKYYLIAPLVNALSPQLQINMASIHWDRNTCQADMKISGDGYTASISEIFDDHRSVCSSEIWKERNILL